VIAGVQTEVVIEEVENEEVMTGVKEDLPVKKDNLKS
jgi:hypothetical protein